ncbi:AI-2E family transporter [Nocardioides daphniae]|uniref:AI-2E family transporter n=1 Tax=Nocardioides daphniae TaxID=402297 RepID=A0A4P7UBF7_9ACTN|nr:AI-2E family transporter [Nocardioides daphniae]QCC76598.1 AI-2E family transporter [Nocardioides daphniae]GGD14454.1 AI-2E family transporter [Nocardioides daphniae]
MTNDEGRERAQPAGQGATHDSAGERLAERLTQQLAQQWAHLRAERRAERHAELAVPPVRPGVSNFSRAQVPWGLDLAAAWSWRFLVIVAAGYVILWTVNRFALVVFPLAIALLLAALVSPLVRAARNVGMPASLGSIFGVTLTFGVVGVLLTFAGQQVASGATELAGEVVKGLEEIRAWLRDGPLHASDSQINDYIGEAQVAITEWSKSDALGQAATLGSAIGNVTAGFFIVLFAMYFFLADGERIWTWIVRLSPRAAREHVDSSGRVAWVSLTQFVRATIIVAFVDSVGIMAVAWWLDVPLVLAIGVLVFLGAFVPMIGATVAGAVAVLVALVDQGPVAALLMLVGVIVVQQVEGNVLQPFLMGRFVSVHPLGVIIAIAMGLILAGIGGALVAVPLAAAINAVVLHLAGRSDPDEIATTDAEEELLEPDEPEHRPDDTSEATS